MRWVYVLGTLATVAVPVADIWVDIDYGFAANLSLTYIAAFVTLFTVLYGIRSRWRANSIGKTFFTKCAFLSLVLWQGVVSTWAGGDHPYRDVIRYVIYTLGAIAYLPMIITLWREQRRDRRDEADALTIPPGLS